MIGINKIPQGINKWIQDRVLDDCRYSLYKRIKKNKYTSFCTYCGNQVEIPYAAHKIQGICPSCKKKVIYRAIGKSKRLFDMRTMAIIEKTNDGFVIRYFNVYKNHKEQLSLPEITIHEEFRIFMVIRNNKIKICSYVPSNFCKISKWRKSTNTEIPDKAYIYTRNLKSVFKDSFYGAEGLIEMFKIADPIYPEDYIDLVINSPEAEFFLKIGLYKIVENTQKGTELKKYINRDGKSLRQILGINKDHLIWLRKLNAETKHLLIMQILVRDNIKFTLEELLEICRTITPTYLSEFIYLIKYCSIHKALKYLKDQFERKKQEEYYNMYYIYNASGIYNYIVSDWYDYITQCIALSYDLKKDYILFPKDLNKRHSELSKLIKANKSKALDKAILARHNLITSCYFYQNNKLMIIVPKSTKEFRDEGASLGHCVAGYSEKFAKGSSDILFIRNVSEPKKSYYTMEIRGMEILQCRGKGNCDMNEEVSNFIKEWKK
ncbi:MAG: PcfJ domain-containing protein, partial [Firmicutes bacterium]|nr:PcfJ domain-containing protein [Bacillota bacterium]